MRSVVRRVMRLVVFIGRVVRGKTCRSELLAVAACHKAVSDETIMLLKQLNEKIGGGL
jgi:hypothetical protein